MFLRKIVESYANYCRKQLQEIDRRLEGYPKGTLHCYHHQNSYISRITVDGKAHYVPRNQRDQARMMAQKALFEANRKDLAADLNACERFLKADQKHPHATERLLENPGIHDLLSGSPAISNETLKNWMNEPYSRNQSFPEGLKIKCPVCGYVRSKTEELCVMLLLQMNIPFHYEELWRRDNYEYYPDFTVRRPRDGQIFLIELFGKMDDTQYLRSAFRKLQIYAEYGFVPDKNLLCFFETSDHPIDMLKMQKTFEYYLLEQNET